MHFWPYCFTRSGPIRPDCAVSSKFNLSTVETEFLKRNQHYDQSYASLNILLNIFGAIFKKDPWDIQLRERILDKQEKLSPAIAHAIKQYMPIALCMDEFREKLRKESKSTSYPATQLEKLLRTISSETT